MKKGFWKLCYSIENSRSQFLEKISTLIWEDSELDLFKLIKKIIIFLEKKILNVTQINDNFLIFISNNISSQNDNNKELKKIEVKLLDLFENTSLKINHI